MNAKSLDKGLISAEVTSDSDWVIVELPKESVKDLFYRTLQEFAKAAEILERNDTFNIS